MGIKGILLDNLFLFLIGKLLKPDDFGPAGFKSVFLWRKPPSASISAACSAMGRCRREPGDSMPKGERLCLHGMFRR